MTTSLDNNLTFENDTSNATPFNLYPITVPQNGFVNIDATITAISDSNVMATWRLNVTGKRGSGNASVQGAITNLFVNKDLGALLWGATFDIDGHDIYVKATGGSSTNIHWTIIIPQAFYYTP